MFFFLFLFISNAALSNLCPLHLCLEMYMILCFNGFLSFLTCISNCYQQVAEQAARSTKRWERYASSVEDLIVSHSEVMMNQSKAILGYRCKEVKDLASSFLLASVVS
jgi:hypothetical protein